MFPTVESGSQTLTWGEGTTWSLPRGRTEGTGPTTVREDSVYGFSDKNVEGEEIRDPTKMDNVSEIKTV